MIAVILAGGMGTRLRRILPDIPKPMAPINGKPFLEYQIELLKRFGVNEIILCVGYLSDCIMKYFGNGSRLSVDITYCIEEELLGTGGALKNAGIYLSETFLALNGDTFASLDFTKLLRFHTENQPICTIALSRISDPSHYGSVEINTKSGVEAFCEKVVNRSHRAIYVNAGVYVFEPRLFRYIPEGERTSLEEQVFPLLLQKGESVLGYVISGPFIDIGTPRDYFRAENELASILSENA